ncbi:hypothetical protein GCM10011386_28180 [Parapedobacter defluvii]|uniref:Response regulatory domain-containing protein n=1 Tax=Parapedobacter defluvii TaxID=2045106 RepID=A0ABQ1M3R1_9SPHI|nr:response regulator [Parapedobacter defluvii]RQP09450.1 MAG: response regulator [Parapedobacter sp.]GGC34449.1 hypothetical protein GCM10011386_28180 [Parapedobacter defluvii]
MKKIIHVLEDDADIGELINFLLTEHGYQVSIFSNIASFRQHSNRESPDLLIIDVMLPDGNGLDICHEWKTNFGTHHIPVLIMSAYEDNRHDKRACNADGFISKPFDIQSFLSDVQARIG